MRAARKRLDLNQTEVARRLGISQSAVSKIESALLIPSAPQWFEFCEMTAIAPDSLVAGYIERNRPAVLETSRHDMMFKMPRAYAENRGSKVRAMLPFVIYFKAVLGEDKFEEYCREQKLDPDLFVDLDNQISLCFCLDLSRHLISKGLLKSKDFPKLTRPVSTPQAHGGLHRNYDGSSSSLTLIGSLLRNSRQYECNFGYEIEEQKQNLLVMSVRPEKHLKGLPYRDDKVLGDFLCKYKQHYFEQFTTYGGARGATLREVECHYHGNADRCVYELRATS